MRQPREPVATDEYRMIPMLLAPDLPSTKILRAPVQVRSVPPANRRNVLGALACKSCHLEQARDERKSGGFQPGGTAEKEVTCKIRRRLSDFLAGAGEMLALVMP